MHDILVYTNNSRFNALIDFALNDNFAKKLNHTKSSNNNNIRGQVYFARLRTGLMMVLMSARMSWLTDCWVRVLTSSTRSSTNQACIKTDIYLGKVKQRMVAGFNISKFLKGNKKPISPFPHHQYHAKHVIQFYFLK